jgi:hypothetical protein
VSLYPTRLPLMSSYSTAPFRRSGSSGSMSSTSKTNSKTVLFDSKTLQGMLGLTPAGAGAGGGKPPKTKADRKALKKATMSRNREYNRMVESILLEETGQVMKRYCVELCCVVLYCIVLYCIVLYCIVLYCIVLYRGV